MHVTAIPTAPPVPAGDLSRPVRRPERPGQPPLRPWSRIWRYLAAMGIAFVIWTAVAIDFFPMDDAVLPRDVEDRIGGALLLDALLGLVGLSLLPMRRRHPVLTASLTALLTSVSASAVGAAVVAAVSAAAWRRWRWLVPVVAVWVAATVCYEVLWRPSIVADDVTAAFAAVSGGLALGVVATCIATGYYVGARRELLVTLQLRAETAEREQALKAEAAREAERTRIAREMHDVLAHRISLVAMHAGALAYRTDLTPVETAEAAGVIQHSAHLALTELRQVLGVLRAAGEHGEVAEPPQPTLTQIGELVESARPHVTVSVDRTGLPGGDDALLATVPETVSRTAYRVVQEALTNACKHASGSDVVVHLAGGPGGLLTVGVHNGPPQPGPAAAQGTPGAGLGLVGLAERVGLAGGALEHVAGQDGSFTVRAWLPWEERE